ncbi:MAG TPA: hypothetical protein VG435_02465 [Acidimicrobiales bacterium]|nr:hypothetical protein [Acidimicrobiales bacterium]
MSNLPVSNVTVSASEVGVESPGFTFVEEDDVLFALRLCREVHGIYGSYHDGSLQATENVWAGLSLTVEMITALRTTVTEGMPAMRLRVAACQAEEINSVLYGRALPARDALNAVETLALDWKQPDVARTAEPARDEVRGWRAGLLAFWHRRSRLFQLTVGLLGCCLAAVLIDAPFAVMALFPNLLIPLAAAFVGVPVAGRMLFRARTRRGRTGGRSRARLRNRGLVLSA